MKKRYISLIVAIVLVFSMLLSGCGKSSKVNGVVELIEKYKRADFDQFIENPKKFISDSIQMMGLLTNKYPSDDVNRWIQGTEDWEENDYFLKGAKERKSDTVLFNRSSNIWVVYIESTVPNMMGFQMDVWFDTGNWEDDYKIARALIDGLFTELGEPTLFSIEHDDEKNNRASEADFRKDFYNLKENILTHGSSGSYSVFWKSIGDEQGTPCTVSFSYDITLTGITSHTVFN